MITTQLYHHQNEAYTLCMYAQKVPLKTAFRIARGAKTEAEVMIITISSGKHTGWAESVPYKRYAESYQKSVEQVQNVVMQSQCLFTLKHAITQAVPGAAKNALDCALWDLQAKLHNDKVLNLLPDSKDNKFEVKPVLTAQTLSIGSPTDMAKAALSLDDAPLIKVKLDGENVLPRMRAIYQASPNSQFIIDANEAWSFDQLENYVEELAQMNVVLIEQPLPESDDAALAGFKSPIALCADESCHTTEGLESLVGKYSVINIKLDKSGGLTEALLMVEKARSLGLDIMVGCMVGSSLAMAPATIVAQQAQYVDLDGPILVSQDRQHPFVIHGGQMSEIDWSLWGGPAGSAELHSLSEQSI